MSEKYEIERKWVVTSDALSELKKISGVSEGTDMLVAYLNVNENSEHRIRREYTPEETRYTQTFKTQHSPNNGIKREIENVITEGMFNSLFEFCGKRHLSKTRYELPIKDDLTLEMNEYHGLNEGACLLEVEFPFVELAEQFTLPKFEPLKHAIEVTELAEHQNKNLAVISAKNPQQNDVWLINSAEHGTTFQMAANKQIISAWRRMFDSPSTMCLQYYDNYTNRMNVGTRYAMIIENGEAVRVEKDNGGFVSISTKKNIDEYPASAKDFKEITEKFGELKDRFRLLPNDIKTLLPKDIV